MHYYGECRPPSGRPPKVYLVIAIIGAILGMINETIGVLAIAFGCYLAWISS